MTIPRNTILNADCLTALPRLPADSVNFILTDPPYLARYTSRDGRTVPNDDNDAWLNQDGAHGPIMHAAMAAIQAVAAMRWDG